MALELSSRYKEALSDRSLQSFASQTPWPHFIFDELLPTKQFLPLQDRLLKSDKNFELKVDHPAKLQLCYMEDLELSRFFFGKEMRRLLETAANSCLIPNEQLAIQFRQMTQESPAFAPHIDLIEKASLVALYYVSPNWAPKNGGELLLLEEERSEIHSEQTKWIEPKQNRLVLFVTGDRYWHSVRRVSNWTRLTVLTEWFLT